MPAMLVAFTLFLIPMTMSVCSDSGSGELCTIRYGLLLSLLLLLFMPVTMAECLGTVSDEHLNSHGNGIHLFFCYKRLWLSTQILSVRCTSFVIAAYNLFLVSVCYMSVC